MFISPVSPDQRISEQIPERLFTAIFHPPPVENTSRPADCSVKWPKIALACTDALTMIGRMSVTSHSCQPGENFK